MLKFLSTILFAVVLTGTANAQIALPSPGKAIMGAGAAKVCLDHKILCAAAAVGVGAYIVNKAGDEIGAKTRGVADTLCDNPSIPIYRSVHLAEYGSIKVAKRYMIAPGGMEVKQFWLSTDNAAWYAWKQDPDNSRRTWLTQSLICPETLALAERFSDVEGKDALAFRGANLELVNNEAKRSGGIHTQEVFR